MKKVPQGTMVGSMHIGGYTKEDLETQANNFENNANNSILEWERSSNLQMVSELREWAKKLSRRK